MEVAGGCQGTRKRFLLRRQWHRDIVEAIHTLNDGEILSQRLAICIVGISVLTCYWPGPNIHKGTDVCANGLSRIVPVKDGSTGLTFVHC